MFHTSLRDSALSLSDSNILIDKDTYKNVSNLVTIQYGSCTKQGEV